jgi:uncharacterized protein
VQPQPLPHVQALLIAGGRGDLVLVQALLTDGRADLNVQDETGSSVLHAATQEQHLPVVKLLAGAGALQSTTDNRGFTPLIVAALHKDVKLTQALLAAPKTAGLNVDARGNFGNTALMTAAQEGHTAVVKALLKAGAALEFVDTENGWTALLSAVYFQKIGVVKVLLAAGAQCQTTSKDGAWHAPDLAETQGKHPKLMAILKKGCAAVGARDEL